MHQGLRCGFWKKLDIVFWPLWNGKSSFWQETDVGNVFIMPVFISKGCTPPNTNKLNLSKKFSIGTKRQASMSFWNLPVLLRLREFYLCWSFIVDVKELHNYDDFNFRGFIDSFNLVRVIPADTRRHSCSSWYKH